MASEGRWELSYYINPIGWSGSAVTFDPDGARKRLDIIRAAGVKWVGMDGVNLLEPAECDVQDAVHLVAEWLEQRELRVSSFHFAGPTFAPPADGQEPVRENMLECVELFKEWRPLAFVIHAGWMLGGDATSDGLRAGIEAEAEKHGVEAVTDVVAGNLKFMARAAARYDIKLAIENMGHTPLGDAGDLPRLVERIDEPNVGYCLDSGHAHHSGQRSEDWAKTAGAKLFETHFHDNRGSSDEHLPVGFGTISWIDVIRALDEIDFPGPVTFETTGWPGDDPVEGYKHAVAWWRACERIALR